MTQIQMFSPGDDRPVVQRRGLEPAAEARLDRLLDRVRSLMQDGEWRTLTEINEECGGTETSVSARLRELRRVETTSDVAT